VIGRPLAFGGETAAAVGGRILALWMLLASPAGAVTLDLHSAPIHDRFVRIGDIATIGGVPENEADSLATVVIGYAPVPGRSRAIAVETVRLFVLQSGYYPHEITITGEAQPVVERPGQVVSAERVAEVVGRELAPLQSDGLTLRVARVSVSGMLPEGPMTVHVPRPGRLDRTFSLPVDVSAGGETVRATVTIQAARQRGIVVATRRIERGEMVTPEMVHIATWNAYDAPRDAATELSQIVGRRATRLLQPNLPVPGSAVEREAAVRRGGRVDIVARIPGLELRTAGESLEDGGVGETVRVRNVESKRIITGRVTAPGEVMIVE
jgi:flagellar basal body P-ring formation protein FlgA